jgi:hypothetical protein
MSTVTFDTMAFVDSLKEAGFDEKQAKALLKAQAESIKQNEFATKQDLAETKLDIIKWMVGLILGQTALLMTVLPKVLGH